MSDELKQFYRELWMWVQDGFPIHAVFHPKRALCTVLTFWGQMNVLHHIDLYSEQNKLFDELGNGTHYPFNQDLDDWVDECRCGEFYQNPKRLAFIEEHAK